jgi:hypothetical protein
MNFAAFFKGKAAKHTGEQSWATTWRRGGIATVVVEREVRVGERWYVYCFQYNFLI